MKGVGGLLAIVSLIAIACAISIIIVSSPDVDAGTTYVEGPWYIDQTTELRDGTWWVNGSIYVNDGTLLLDHAELVVGRADDSSLCVNDGGRMVARNSTIRGNTTYIYISIYDDTTLDNTTIRDVSYIYQPYGDLLIDHCSVVGYYTYSYWNLTVRQSRFVTSSGTAITWSPGSSGSEPFVALIVDTTFEGTGSGSALSFSADSSYIGECAIEVRDCTIRNVSTAISVNWYTPEGSIIIRGNDASRCSTGFYFYGYGEALRMRDNSWSMGGTSGYGIYLSLTSSAQPDVSNETVVGGNYGLALDASSTRPHISLWDLDITGSTYGISVSYVYLDLYNSRIRGRTYDFYLYGNYYIHLHGCDHTYKGYVSGSYGSISEVRTVNITSVSWQDGTAILEGTTSIENETGYVLAERDNVDPWPVDLPLWLRTRYDNVTARTARGAYEKDGLEFRSAPFDFTSLDRYDMVIYDNFTPEAVFTSPRDGDRFPTNVLLVKGNLTERGVGLASVRMRFTGGNWTNVSTYPDSTWQVRFEALPEGLLDFTLNITDRAWNSRDVILANITIDTIWPFIEVQRPAKWVRSSPVRLVARTEVGAQAWVDYAPAAVMPDGMFSAIVDVYGPETVIDIRVVDVVGHENMTKVKVLLDTTPPGLQVDSPLDGSWTSAEAVEVVGTTEPDAVVSVNGYTGTLEEGLFRVEVPLGAGTVVLTVTATDPAGNWAAVVRVIDIDRKAPVLKVLSPADGCMTSRDRVVVSGTVEDGGPVTVTVGGLWADLAGGSWTREVALVEGPNRIAVIATDAAGNGASGTVLVTLDTVPPDVEATLVAGGAELGPGDAPLYTRETRVDIHITVDEDCTVHMTGGATTSARVGTSTVSRDLVPGENAIVLRAADAVGNGAPPLTFIVVSDAAPPPLTVLYPSDTEAVLFTRGPVITLVGLTEPGAEVTVNGVPAPVLSNGSFALVVALEVGPTPLIVMARDRAGNQASESVQVVREEEEQTSPSGAAMVAGGATGLVVGLVVALAVSWAVASRRRPPERRGTDAASAQVRPQSESPPQPRQAGEGGPQGGPQQRPERPEEWEQF